MGLVSDPASENARRDAAISLMLEDTVASHFLQRVIELASARLLQTLFDRYFSGRLHKLAQHASANFVVQSLLANAKSERQLRAMISEVQPIIARLLFGQRAGVVRALLDSCVRLRACALEIMNALYSGLGIGQESERAELINLLAFLIPHAELAHADYERLPFRIQGALIIQSILKLPGEGSQPLVDSFLAQPHARMHSWCMDASGSRIVEALIASSSISADDRRRCLERFSTHYADLAANKYGSHIVDACWKCSDMPYKEKIMIELIQREALVQDSPFGRIVMRNCRVEQYKRRADEWRERERSLQKGKRLFKDILDDNDGDVKSKKSKKSEKTKAKKSKLNNKLK
ncbi:Nucleolar protein 9 [Coemansia erecta]|nr:Nucleolar protein 9 [Coemansia erecta]